MVLFEKIFKVNNVLKKKILLMKRDLQVMPEGGLKGLQNVGDSSLLEKD